MNVKRHGFAGLLTLIAIGLFWPATLWAQGFAGLGQEADEFSRVSPETSIIFPRDHGPHPDFRIEWWYVTANLTDDAGMPLGLQWTLFRQALTPGGREEGWQSGQLFLGHAALTTSGTHRFAERLARGGIGQAGVKDHPFSAHIDNWNLSSNADQAGLSHLQLSANARDFSFTITLKSHRPPVLQGIDGYSVKSEQGQASHYYSQPFFKVVGEVTIDDTLHQVTGQAWMDREWSSQPLGANQEGWDWFSLHLNTGDKVMLFRLRDEKAKRDFYSGTWITPEGDTTPLTRDAITITPLTKTRLRKRSIPTYWRVEIPQKNLNIKARALNPESFMATLFPYWEGPIQVSGSHTGVGYLEMTGY